MFKHKSLVPLIAAVAMLAACAAPTPQTPQQPTAEPTQAAPAAPAQPAADGPAVAGVDRRFDGVTLRAAFIGGGQYERMYESIKDWEAATGAKVDIVYKGDGFEIDKKLKTDFAAGTGDYDVVWNHTSFFSQYIPFLEPLENYFSQEELKDFSQAILKSATRDGHLWLIPRHADISVVHYRTDLYNNEQYKAEFKAKYGYDLAPPETWQQFFDHAEFFTGKEPGLFGTNFAGKEEALSGRFYEILVANGGKMLDENFKPAFNSEAGVKTAQFFRELYARKLVPADMTSLLWDGVANNFCQGNIAVHNEWFGWYSYFQDPKNCKVAGKFDLIRQPVGEAGIRSGWAGAHAFSIPASSKNKEAAAALIKFLTSEKIMYEEAKLGFLPVRDSVWARIIADAAKSDNPLDKKRLEIAQVAIANDFFAPPLIAEWIPLTNILTPKLQAIMLGDIDAKQGLDEAAAEVEKMLAEAGYYNR